MSKAIQCETYILDLCSLLHCTSHSENRTGMFIKYKKSITLSGFFIQSTWYKKCISVLAVNIITLSKCWEWSCPSTATPQNRIGFMKQINSKINSSEIESNTHINRENTFWYGSETMYLVFELQKTLTKFCKMSVIDIF